MSRLWCTLSLLPLLLATFHAPAVAQWAGQLRVRERVFAQRPAGGPGGAHEPTVFGSARWKLQWQHGAQQVSLAASLEVNPADGSQTLFDIDDLSWRFGSEHVAVRAGVGEVTWGVTEAAHVVDVINQRVTGAGAEGDIKLGQPMVNAALQGWWGTFDVYLLPGFRTRPFRGRAGRLWSPNPTAATSTFDSPQAQRHVDWAARWAISRGPLDIAAGYFRGTERDPVFSLETAAAGAAVLIPRYELGSRASLDLQWTRGPVLWKLELVNDRRKLGAHQALAAGIEYVVADYLSFFAEYLHDTRGPLATTSLEHDLFLGTRLLYQDGQVASGVIVDRVTGNVMVSAQASRRLSSSLSLGLEGRVFTGNSTREPLLAPRWDTNISAALNWYY
ncbi:MAG: hypothetical protein HY700_02250 [Gemmatimonadetes bacterium]|nr:hypothetical protein [Gemmatimonadota bacterium]